MEHPWSSINASIEFDEMQLMQYRAVKYPRVPKANHSKNHLLVYRGVEYTSGASEKLADVSDHHSVVDLVPSAHQSIAA